MYCLLVVVCHSTAIYPIVAQEGQDVANKGRKYDGVTPLPDFDSSVFKSKDYFSEFFQEGNGIGKGNEVRQESGTHKG